MGEEKREVLLRDIRRYCCQFCGLCRSKKSLVAPHIQSHHQDKIESQKEEATEDVQRKEGSKMNVCEECGVSFQKPAHLKQHMQSHSLELFECPIDGCKSTFSFQGNMTRHVDLPKQYVCSEVGCEKIFKYASKLKKHEDSHVKLEMIEALCLEPGCMNHFTNEKCLNEHIESCHQHVVCEICGTKQLKNIKRHLHTHEEGPISERVKCEFQDCQHTFCTRSSLAQHIKAVHVGAKLFSCSISGCGMKFAFKHDRDKHDKSGCHVYTPGDLEVADKQFLSRPRGSLLFESMRKRVTPPSVTDSEFNQTPESLSWLHSAESDSQI
ncbi:unnamed protein product [Withania somnifera]